MTEDPASSARGAHRRPEIVLVCHEWQGGEGDPESMLRILLGALAPRCRVTVASLEPEGAASERTALDGLFAVHRLPAGAKRRGDRFFEAALALAGRPAPDWADEPSGMPPSQLITLLGRQPEATVVCAGGESLSVAPVLRAARLGRRLVALPLGRRRALGGAAGAFDAIAALSRREAEEVAAVAPGRAIEVLRPPVRIQEDLSPPDLGGLGGDLPMLVVLSGTTEGHEPLLFDHGYVRARLGAVVVAEVRPDRLVVTDPGRRHEVAWPPARMDLWRLMRTADVLLDLRPQGPFGREALESLLFATPVVVPAGSAAASHAAESGGGRSFGDPPEMFGHLSELFGDAAARAEMGETGRRWARSLYATGPLGDEALARLVLGEEG